MDISIITLVVGAKGIQHSARFLRARGIVKIDKRMAVDRLLEDWKILPDGSPVDRFGGNFVHSPVSPYKRQSPNCIGQPAVVAAWLGRGVYLELMALARYGDTAP